MTASTVSLNPTERRALRRHQQGTTVPTDLPILGTILDRLAAGADWTDFTTAPAAPRVGRIPQAMKPTTGRCDYCPGECDCNELAA